MAKRSIAGLVIALLTLCAVSRAYSFTFPWLAPAAPEPPASQKSTAPAAASQHFGFDRAATDKKVVALTFDADMTPGMLSALKSKRIASWYNEKVIAALREQQVPATLFLN